MPALIQASSIKIAPVQLELYGGLTRNKSVMQSCHSLLQDSTFHTLLLKIDEDLAQRVRLRGCPFCCGVLHRADYPRKPRGPGSCGRRRISLCCNREGCRRRVTPPSVRFMGRRVFQSVVVLLVAALRQGPRPARSRVLAELFEVDERTIRRWRRWWDDIFITTDFWIEAKARFMPPVRTLPLGLIQRFGNIGSRSTLSRLLAFLSPLSSARCLFDQFARTVRAFLATQKLSSHVSSRPM